MQEVLEKELVAGLRAFGLPRDRNQVEALLKYLQLLGKWNQTYNLVVATDNRSMVSRHILDSLTIHPYLTGKTIVDVGSGAGLPGIPLAIFNPDKTFVLVDSNGKKTRFLFQVKIALNLENISVENCRIEHYQSNLQIDMVMCRAFSSLAEVAEKTRHLLGPGGKACKILALKGRYPEQEIASLAKEISITRIEKLEIPGSDSQRHLIELQHN